MKPTVGRIVHFVEEGVEGPSAHRAAIVTEVYADGTRSAGMVQLYVYASVGPRTINFVREDATGRPLTWHWPEGAPTR